MIYIRLATWTPGIKKTLIGQGRNENVSANTFNKLANLFTKGHMF